MTVAADSSSTVTGNTTESCYTFEFLGMGHEEHHSSALVSIHESLEWGCFLISIGLFVFYLQQYRKKTAGWEGEESHAICLVPNFALRATLTCYPLCRVGIISD